MSSLVHSAWSPLGTRHHPVLETASNGRPALSLPQHPGPLPEADAHRIATALDAPPCCARALVADLTADCDVDLVQARYTRTRGAPHPLLAPDLAATSFPPCSFDCPAALARATPVPQPSGRLFWLGEGWYVRFAPDGSIVSSRLSPELSSRLGDFRSSVQLAQWTLTDGQHTVDLRPWTLRPFEYRPGQDLQNRPLDVVVVDFQRWEVDFSGAQELQFAAADLARMGHRVRLYRAVVGLSGEHLTDVLRQKLVSTAARADLLCARVHVSDDLFASLPDTHRLFLISTIYERPPPPGRYDSVVHGGRRHELVALADALARGSTARPALAAEGVPFAYGDAHLYFPATHSRDPLTDRLAAFPRQLLVTARGCPHSNRIDTISDFDGLTHGDSVNAAGCTYCPLGADYRAPPVRDYIGFLVDQIAWYTERAPESELLVADEASFSFLDLLVRRVTDRGLRPGPLLFKARLNGLVPRLDRFRQALERARTAGLTVSCYLLGIENFSGPELRRYNKGVEPDALLEGLRTLLDLERELAGTFSFSHHNSHGFILFNPWTELTDLEANRRAFRAIDIQRLSGKATWSRLRLHRWQPLYALAKRDGLVDPDGSRFHAVVPRQLGYHPDELPWRFRSPAVELVYWLTTQPAPPPHNDWGGDLVSRFEAALQHVQADPPTEALPLDALRQRLVEFFGQHAPRAAAPPLRAQAPPDFRQVLDRLQDRYTRLKGRPLPRVLSSVEPSPGGWRLTFQNTERGRSLVVVVDDGTVRSVENLKTRGDRAFVQAFAGMLPKR
jgi:hypothetical protein